MSSPVVTNFMKQQGFPDEPADACNMHFSALYFQPRIVFPLVLLGILLQSPAVFLALAAVLWWNVAVPRLNPFELVYNRFVGPKRGLHLSPAPAPRRFAQGVAAAFLTGAGLALLAGWTTVSWVFQGFVVIAFVALLLGKFCAGAYVYHVMRGEVAFANSTLPWGRAGTERRPSTS